MANTDKTKAELYREERKARLAKAAKKRNKKKMGKGPKAVIAVLVAIVIAAGVCGYSFVSLGVSRQMKTVYSIADVGDVSLAEYSYYYNQIFSYYFNNAYSYEQYYSSYYGEGAGAYFMGGYEYTESPELQAFPETHSDYDKLIEEGFEEPTWADYFDYTARFQMKQIKGLCTMAEKAGYKLDKEGEEEVKEAYEQMSQASGQAMISTNKYLSIYYGKGVTKGLVKKILKQQTIAQHYQEVLLEQYRDSLSDEEILKGYEDNKASYDTANLAYYSVAAEQVTTKDENGDETSSVTSKTLAAAKVKADELAKAKDYKALNSAVRALGGTLQSMNGVTADTVSQYMGEEVSDWLFNTKKLHVGDIKVIEQDNSGYIVCCVTALPSRDDTKMVTIRQIEIEIPEEEEDEDTTEDEEEMTQEEIEAAQKETEEAAKAAEEAAAALQKENEETPALDTFTDAPVYNDVLENTSNADTYLTAELILRNYLAGDRTQDSFKALADKQSNADTESEDYTDSSLIEKIYPNSGSVDSEVEAWALDKSRKAGDVGIVECEGEAYYILYFVETLEDSYWEDCVKDELGYGKIDSDINSFEATVVDADAVQSVIDATMVFAKKQIASAASSSSSSLLG